MERRISMRVKEYIFREFSKINLIKKSQLLYGLKLMFGEA